MVQWLTQVFETHGFDLNHLLTVLGSDNNLQEENSRLRHELGQATGLISAIQAKINELNQSLGQPDESDSDTASNHST